MAPGTKKLVPGGLGHGSTCPQTPAEKGGSWDSLLELNPERRPQACSGHTRALSGWGKGHTVRKEIHE